MEELTVIKNFDVQKIAEIIMEKLMPLLELAKEEDEIMSVDGLAAYLKVNKSWVYKKVQFKEIPFTHLGKFPRFRRSVIDDWFAKGCPDIRPIPKYKELRVV